MEMCNGNIFNQNASATEDHDIFVLSVYTK